MTISLAGAPGWALLAGATYEYGPNGFGGTVQVTQPAAAPVTTASMSDPAQGYAGATVVSDTYGGESVWLGAGQNPGAQLGCGSGQATAVDAPAAPAGSVLYVLVDQQGNPLGLDAVACTAEGTGAAPPPPPPPPPTGAQVWSAEAKSWQDLVSSGIEVNPQTLGLTGLSSWFWLTNGTTTLTAPPATVDGYSVRASASISSYTWEFGDGYSATAYGPGSSAEPAVTHTYDTKGQYTVSVVAHYVGTFTFSGFGVQARTEPFAIDVTMGTLAYGVQEVRSVLVSPEADQ